MTRLFLLALALGVCFTAAAQQYKWVDKDGRTQYGDAPPPGVKATPLRPPPPPAANPAAKSASTASKDADFRKRQGTAEKDRDKQANAEKEAELKKRNCASAQDAVRTLEQGRVRRLDSKGEFVFLDDAQLAQELAKAKKSVAEFCS